MLVLGRRQNQWIQVGDDIRVIVVRASNGTVRIGIECPQEIRVLRGELLEEENPYVDRYRNRRAD